MRAVHYQTSRRRTRSRGWIPLLILVIVVVIVAAVLIRAETETAPDLKVGRLVGTSLRFPGARPAPAWPSQGQAAVGVVGLGRLRSSAHETPAPTASVAKIMTAYLVLRDHPLALGRSGFKLTVTAADVAEYQAENQELQSTVPVVQGEALDEYQLLEALLIPSGNNIAELLARYDAGSETGFVTEMNRTAKSLGMTQTTYTDPSGYATTTVSTASDQVRLAEAAIRNPVFDRIIAIRSVSLPDDGTVHNFNHLLGHDGFVGIKTGSDSEAGGCFVFSDRQVVGGRYVTVVGAILGLDKGQMDTTTLLDAALDASSTLVHSVAPALSTRTLLPAGTVVADVTNAQGRRVSAATTGALRTLGWGGLTIPLEVVLHPLGKHVGRGQPIAAVTLAGDPARTTPADATTAMPAVSFGWRLHHLF